MHKKLLKILLINTLIFSGTPIIVASDHDHEGPQLQTNFMPFTFNVQRYQIEMSAINADGSTIVGHLDRHFFIGLKKKE
ncbi:MAG: hypothetical protein BGO77_07185 [Caedibacter sp. 37-49]|nr:MAG: hypothetical protein BGO77_07185 [Caedibacter sp. 37-49]